MKLCAISEGLDIEGRFGGFGMFCHKKSGLLIGSSVFGSA